MKTRPVTWFVLVLCIVTGVLIVSMEPAAGPASRQCKPLNHDELLLGFDKDHLEAAADFIEKAERLNMSGQCVIEGGFGKAYQKFYFAIDRDGQPRNYYFLRFTRDELRK